MTCPPRYSRFPNGYPRTAYWRGALRIIRRAARRYGVVARDVLAWNRTREVTEARAAAACDLHLAGFDQTQIGEFMGIDPKTARFHIARAGLLTGKPQPKNEKERRQRLYFKCAKRGLTANQTARLLGVGVEAVWRAERILGIKMGPGMKIIQAQPVEYDGQVWPSIKSLATANGVCDGSVHKALERGHWHGKPIRRVDRDEARGITPDQRAEHDAIEALLAKCSDGVQGRWRAAG